ncbi:FIST signal transduction protein [Thiosocius teredinicola]|uniref:FIST signal transduction protein n=1 Tax=Thiosocius teredinicola TaxID=1973002 RepID=UPI00099132F3
MRIATSYSTAADEQTAVTELTDAIEGASPDLLIAYASVGYSAEQILPLLQNRYPDTPMLGGTSCQGVMSAQGFHSRAGSGVGMFAVFDPNGAYGAAAEPSGDDARAAAKAATERALEVAGRAGEMPTLIWLSAAPGREEAILAGIADVVGPNVPVAGGSTADNDVSGKWHQFCDWHSFTDAVSVAVLFPSTSVAWSFHSGYQPTEHKGRVTRAENRTIREIDGQPAADVYEAWTAGALQGHTREPCSVLSGTSLFPLGRPIGANEGVDYFRLSHPEAVTESGGLRLFTDVAEGDEIVLMTGDRESLLTRAGRVAVSAARSVDMQTDDIAGALVIYCAGCMLTVQDQMHRVPAEISAALGSAPFLGAFTFGEQGCISEGRNYHGNLMISVVLFGKVQHEW